MDKTKLVLGVSCVAVAALALAYCGGGGEKSALAPLDAQSAETLARDVAQVLPGCSFVAVGMPRAVPNAGGALARKAAGAVAARFAAARAGHGAMPAPKRVSYDINEQTPGDCGGYALSTGTHSSGTTKLTITYTDYCTRTDGSQLVLNGSMEWVEAGHPSDSGPVTDEIRMSTANDGLVLAETSDGETTTSRLVIDSFRYQVGNPGGESSAASPDVLTVERVRVVEEGRTTKEVKDAKLTTWSVGCDQALRIDRATLTDAEIGSVTVTSGTMIAGETWQGSLTITGSDGTSMTLSADPFAEGVFTVTHEGQSLGALDCSSLGSAELLGE